MPRPYHTFCGANAAIIGWFSAAMLAHRVSLVPESQANRLKTEGGGRRVPDRVSFLRENRSSEPELSGRHHNHRWEGRMQKKEYHKPEIKSWGTVADLTATGMTHPGNDAKAGSAASMGS